MQTKTTASKPVTKKAYEAALERWGKNAKESKSIIAKSEEKIAAEMTARHTKLGNMPTELVDDAATIKQYCEENRDTLFGDKKSIGFAHGTLSFRAGGQALVMDGTKEEKEAKEAAMISAFKKRGLMLYITVKESLDKKKVINDREDKTVVKVLEAAGASVEQGENFSIALN